MHRRREKGIWEVCGGAKIEGDAAGFYRLPAAGGLFGKKERGNVGCLVREVVGGVFGKGICGLGGLFGFF